MKSALPITHRLRRRRSDYDSDRAARELCLADLFVVEAAPGRGAGRALLATVAAEPASLRRLSSG
jgi:hypothetical protein